MKRSSDVCQRKNPGQKSGGRVPGVARPHFWSFDSFLDIEVGVGPLVSKVLPVLKICDRILKVYESYGNDQKLSSLF